MDIVYIYIATSLNRTYYVVEPTYIQECTGSTLLELYILAHLTRLLSFLFQLFELFLGITQRLSGRCLWDRHPLIYILAHLTRFLSFLFQGFELFLCIAQRFSGRCLWDGYLLIYNFFLNEK